MSSLSAPPAAFYVTGTDTGIGKTFSSCALLHALRQRGHRAVGMKPVASGCEQTADGLRNAIRDAREIKKDVEEKLTTFLTDFTRRFTQA